MVLNFSIFLLNVSTANIYNTVRRDVRLNNEDVNYNKFYLIV